MQQLITRYIDCGGGDSSFIHERGNADGVREFFWFSRVRVTRALVINDLQQLLLPTTFHRNNL
jgi:hypothetical protein